KDVARIELGGENYNVVARINGKPASGLGIKLATGANALDTATGFDFELIDQGGLGHTALTQARNQLLGMVKQHPDQLVRVR
ncbi:efflux RND transporter permease subunit, partial [Klebsiella pneumoniae]|uniref:efflux RND transporter permease subunit n=1 Tax=Klebsiella pneumoniae TaxID=573 RepID=UPI002380EBD9